MERDCTTTSDPEVQCAATNPLSHLGEEEQREPFRAVTQFKKGEGSAQRERKASEWTTLRESTGQEDRDNEDGREDHTMDGTEGIPTDDRTARPSGEGGAQCKLQPRLGKSVALSGAWLS
ncbi:hypothetical protein NDU88_001285 [Pleurodeles waltl]|uniref:Uncharacterized protein n=1 Tax=Pleurodeles waltl TaxID=8319 RepID=A0AAV7SA04_PLEWA|nr:hypothetical protein NDU88_001285 [Pleurodeles waltl]